MSTRLDLLALSLPDLELFSNRGTVKRAAREIEAGEVQCEWVEDPTGDLVAQWSDGERCILPANGTISDGRCSCPAGGLCRHLIRTVLAYQGSQSKASDAWDPGSIDDAQLEIKFGLPALRKARELFDGGLLIELMRSNKPLARIHGPGIAVRFLVPHDLRYCRVDCNGTLGDQAIIMAVWAFRRLEASSTSGWVVSASRQLEFPRDLVGAVEDLIATILNNGLEGLPPHFDDRIRQLEIRLRQAQLIWPADTLTELAGELERYSTHDNLFDSEHLLDLAGEFLARLRALCSAKHTVPQLLVAGSPHNQPQEFNKRRFTGLGSQATLMRKSTIIRIWLEDGESGSIVFLEKAFSHTNPAEARSFASLADYNILSGCRMVDIARSHILASGGKQSAGGNLSFARKTAVQPQDFAWDSLRGAFFAEDFAELAQRLAGLPPTVLRSRRGGEDFFVLKPASNGQASFSNVDSCYQMDIYDPAGIHVRCVLPWVDQAAGGGELWLSHLANGGRVCFVSGTVRQRPGGLQLEIAALVIENQGKRQLIQPWLEQYKATNSAVGDAMASPANTSLAQTQAITACRNLLARLCLSGLERSDDSVSSAWHGLAKSSADNGFVRLAKRQLALAKYLKRRAHGDKDCQTVLHATLRDLLVWLRLAQEL